MMKKLNVCFLFLTVIILGWNFSTVQAQTTKGMVTERNQELYPEADHSDDPYYCYTYSSERENIALTLTEEEDALMGVIQVGPPDSYTGENNQPLYFFLSGSWVDGNSAEFVMYMFDENEEIIEESKQEVSLKIVSDFEIAFTDGDGKEIILDQVLCEEDE